MYIPQGPAKKNGSQIARRQDQAEVVSNSKNTILATWEPFFLPGPVHTLKVFNNEMLLSLSHFLFILTYQFSSASLRCSALWKVSHFQHLWCISYIRPEKNMIYTSMGGRGGCLIFEKLFHGRREGWDGRNEVTSAAKVWEEFEVFSRSTTPNAKSDFYMEVALL